MRAFSVHLRWPTVAEYYRTDSDHANWIRFHESYRREFEAKVRNPHSRFRQKAVPGSSQTGWFCHERRIPPEFLGAPTGWVAGTSWIGDVLTFSTEKLDAAGEGFLTPVLFSPAQQHTQVDCGRLRHLLHYLDSIGYRYRDLEFADEASIDGNCTLYTSKSAAGSSDSSNQRTKIFSENLLFRARCYCEVRC
eukprot:COSAG01_NODE_10921_length_2050_cov_2.561763_3_plen_191_part_01